MSAQQRIHELAERHGPRRRTHDPDEYDRRRAERRRAMPLVREMVEEMTECFGDGIAVTHALEAEIEVGRPDTDPSFIAQPAPETIERVVKQQMKEASKS